MGFFDSIFGIDVFGDGKPDITDDLVILDILETDERKECKGDNDFNVEDDVVASNAIDEGFDF